MLQLGVHCHFCVVCTNFQNTARLDFVSPRLISSSIEVLHILCGGTVFHYRFVRMLDFYF